MKIRFLATGKVVARPRVRPTGLFTATAKLPRRKLRAINRARYRAVGGAGSEQAAVYRLQTRVRKFASNPRLYPTFTLPRYVDLAQ